MPLYLDEGEIVAVPPEGKKAIVLNTDGDPVILDSDGVESPMGGGAGTVTVASPLTGVGSVADPITLPDGLSDSILLRAQSLIPTADFDTVLGSDFETTSWFGTQLLNGGTVPLSVTDKGGVARLVSGATANGIAVLFPVGGGSAIDNARTSPWYFYARIKVATTVDAVGIARIGISAISAGVPANPGVAIGATGAVSTTNFSYRVVNSGGTVVDSGNGPALDTNWHTVEMHNDATTVTFLFDGVSIGTTAATNVGAVPMFPQGGALNGGTTANREIDVDKLWFVCKGN